MPPSTDAPGAIPRGIHAAVTGLRERHEITLVTVAGPDPWELEAADRIPDLGIEAYVVRRRVTGGSLGWRRRTRLAWGWTGRRWPWRTAWFHEPQVQRIIDRLARERAFDVVAVEDNSMASYRYPGDVPAVLTEHEVRRPRPIRWPRLWAKGALRQALAELDWHRWPRYEVGAWSRFDLLQVFTERDAAALAALAPPLRERIRVNPFGIDLPRATGAAAQVAGELLFVGNMTHAPNVDAALWLGREVLPLLRARRPEAHLTIAGAYPPPEVEALASEHVLVTGWMRDLDPVMERAQIVLAPVRIGGGMRRKVLEAMAFGKTVVTTPRGAEGLGLHGAPPLVVADGAEAIAEETARLLADAAARESLGEAARAFVAAHYGPGAYAQRLESVYEEAHRR
jgi:glycosyltransferase involved in cell wall biosynthesis